MSHSMKNEKKTMPEAVQAWKTFSVAEKEKWNLKAKKNNVFEVLKEDDKKPEKHIRKTHKKSGI